MILNGTGIPRVRIYSDSTLGTLVDTIDLPRCNIEGFQNQLEFDVINHNLANGKRLQEIEGFHYNFVLNYVGLIFSEDFINVLQIYNYKRAGYSLVLVPHIDVLSIFYEVNITQGIGYVYDTSYPDAGQGFQGVVMGFNTVNRLSSLPIVNPLDVSFQNPYQMNG